jgi:hypothetical protein
MTYEGIRARSIATEERRVFEVSSIQLDSKGWPAHVLWAEVSPASNLNVCKPFMVPVADVVNALQDGAQVLTTCLPPYNHLPSRHLIVLERDGNPASITLASRSGQPSHTGATPDLGSIAILKPELGSSAKFAHHSQERTSATFAVSRVALDAEGRITELLWGPVDTIKNDWAGPEVVVPVAQAVALLRRGGHVFALFPSEHGHLPDRRFKVANYDDGRQTLVLDGPTAYERDIHDMDRLNPVHSEPAIAS